MCVAPRQSFCSRPQGHMAPHSYTQDPHLHLNREYENLGQRKEGPNEESFQTSRWESKESGTNIKRVRAFRGSLK